MKKVNLMVLALVAACLLAAPLVSCQGGSAEQQVSTLSDQMIQAQLKADVSFFEKHYADDATIIHGNGKQFTKDQEIADLKSGSLKYESIDTRERKIHVYGDTAVVSFLISFKGAVSGQPLFEMPRSNGACARCFKRIFFSMSRSRKNISATPARKRALDQMAEVHVHWMMSEAVDAR